MKRFHWTWEQLQATPVHVVNKCIELLLEEQDDIDEAMEG
jgi:hypothetical protein